MPSSAIVRRPAHERLIEAAARVFARDGLTGATTREIAKEAGVNEVTLFRHFRSKERLLAAVVKQNFGNQTSGLNTPMEFVATTDLRADLANVADAYGRQLKENLPLVRAMIGEIHHHGDNERQVYRGLFQSLREAIERRFDEAKKARALRADADPVMLADLFIGMIFTDVLRRASATFKRHYSSSAYFDAAVDLIVRGAAR
ncbi:MAG: TetR/AcrR family transcriptional regulator [Nibricoccus sp.]